MPLEELDSCTATSGTTGDPELIAEAWDVVPPLPMVTARDLWELGLRPGDRVLMPAGSFRNFWDEFFGLMGLVPIFVDAWIGQGESVLQRDREVPARLHAAAPAGHPRVRAARSRPRPSVPLLLHEGRRLRRAADGQVLARKVRDEWGLEVFKYTSAGDTGTAWEHREHDGYTLWEDTVFPECLEPDSNTRSLTARSASSWPRTSTTWQRR